jgi:hypothetical protein
MAADPHLTEDDRRPRVSWRRALAVIVAALALAALLDADGLRKGAVTREDGTARDVAMALTDPLQRVSDTLYLNRPRRWIKTAVGREDDDRIDTTIVAPAPVPAPRPSPTPRPTPKPALGGEASAKPKAPRPAPTPLPPRYTAAKPLRLWVAGDSLAEVPGLAIVRLTGRVPTLRAVGERVRARIGTGLGRPDVYNWFTEIPDAIEEAKPDVVVLALGGNDFHSYMSGVPEGVEVGAFTSPSWNREYRRRVGILLDTVASAGADVVWLGLPRPESPNMAPRFDVLNRLIRAEVEERPAHAMFLDTTALLTRRGGRYAEYLPDASGRRVRVRAADGLHLARAGGDRVAEALAQLLTERYRVALGSGG